MKEETALRIRTLLEVHMGILRTHAWSQRTWAPIQAATAGPGASTPRVAVAGAQPETTRSQTLVTKAAVLLIMGTLLVVGCAPPTTAPPPSAKDPGVRGGPAGAGSPLPGLTSAELAVFEAGRASFLAVEAVKDGLGPRFNLDSCGGCHAQPAAGGSSPSVNPQVGVATKAGAKNIVPPFITLNGPIGQVRS